MKDDSAPSFEGFLTGLVAGHYRIARPRLVISESRIEDMSGDAWVPRERVLFLQELK